MRETFELDRTTAALLSDVALLLRTDAANAVRLLVSEAHTQLTSAQTPPDTVSLVYEVLVRRGDSTVRGIMQSGRRVVRRMSAEQIKGALQTLVDEGKAEAYVVGKKRYFCAR